MLKLVICQIYQKCLSFNCSIEADNTLIPMLYGKVIPIY